MVILFQASRVVLNQSGGVEGGEGASTTTTATTTTATTTTTTTMATTTQPCIDDPRLTCDIDACSTDLATFCPVTCNLCP
ncbi:probable serine/threonine-protein kinase smg1 [Mytilus edulis]|uniref:probable serine/threonine-protein kinase smg1 n=1 Tax=Mytilus edulis TaxID=6550 RepID=UPI0039EECB5B